MFLPKTCLPLNVCYQCLSRAAETDAPISSLRGLAQWRMSRTTSNLSPRLQYGLSRRSMSSIAVVVNGAAAGSKAGVNRQYFLDNSWLAKGDGVKPQRAQRVSTVRQGAETSSEIPESTWNNTTEPHKRRRRKDDNADSLPADDASAMSSAAIASRDRRRIYKAYLALSKPRLTALVVLTSMASYALFPTSELLASSPTAPTTALSALTLLFLTIGTTLCSSSANSLNMLMEPHLDAKMTRTRNRPLVRGIISPRSALLFAIITGTIGTTALYYGVNPTVAALGFGNIVLYAGCYTPLKRIHPINTWVGAIVGAIPPLMGWAAAANADATNEDWMSVLSHPGGWLFAALLFAWQFPHFNALSWSIRKEYAAAGFKMLASSNVGMNGRVAVRYAVACWPICWGLWYTGVTDWVFVVDSGVVNAWLVWESVKFWKYEGEKGTAKRLFWASVWHLPLIFLLAMAHKTGLWKGLYESIAGREDDDEWEEYEEAEAAPIAMVSVPRK